MQPGLGLTGWVAPGLHPSTGVLDDTLYCIANTAVYEGPPIYNSGAVIFHVQNLCRPFTPHSPHSR